MPTCILCKNDYESGSEIFLPSSCGKCGVCIEKRGAVLPNCTAAVSGDELRIIISADDTFSRPNKVVSVSLNEAISFDRASLAQKSCVDQNPPRINSILDGQSLEEFTLTCDQ